MMISQTAEYALRAVVAIAEGGGRPRITPDIARLTRVSQGYLYKVLRLLSRDGFVRAQRGIGGGFTLTRPPADITVLDVITAIEPFHKSSASANERSEGLCALRRLFDDAGANVESLFSHCTIEDLIHGAGSPRPSNGDALADPSGDHAANGATVGAGDAR